MGDAANISRFVWYIKYAVSRRTSRIAKWWVKTLFKIKRAMVWLCEETAECGFSAVNDLLVKKEIGLIWHNMVTWDWN